MIVALLLAAADTTASDMLKAQNTWQDCVMANAERWASTNESVEFVVKTALGSCGREKYEMRQATIRANSHFKPATKAMAYANAWLEGTEEGVKNGAIRRVLDLRSQKAE